MIMKKVWEGQHSDTVVLLTYPLTNIIQDKVKEGKSLGLSNTCLTSRVAHAIFYHVC